MWHNLLKVARIYIQIHTLFMIPENLIASQYVYIMKKEKFNPIKIKKNLRQEKHILVIFFYYS